MTTLHCLYRWFDADGKLLYVGMTGDLPKRTRAHQKSQLWWALVRSSTVEHFDSREDLKAAEARAIASENPRFNKVRPKVAGEAQPEVIREPTSKALVIADLRRRISSGEWAPGTVLPSRDALHILLDEALGGVSRYSVKHAIWTLRRAGEICLRPGVGLFIPSAQPASITAP